MNWKITEKETKWQLFLKLLYLIPLFIIAYIPMAIYEGLKEMATPIEFIREIKKVWYNAK